MPDPSYTIMPPYYNTCEELYIRGGRYGPLEQVWLTLRCVRTCLCTSDGTLVSAVRGRIIDLHCLWRCHSLHQEFCYYTSIY